MDRPSPLPARPDGPVRLAVSRSRPPAFVVALAESLGAELVAMGSAGVKAMAVVDGTVDAYVHAGGQYEWDSAAPVAVALGHDLAPTRLDGSPLEYNRENPWLPTSSSRGRRCSPRCASARPARLRRKGAGQAARSQAYSTSTAAWSLQRSA